MPQLDVTTFYLQATTVWFAFLFTQAMTITYIIPRISISLCIREVLSFELEEFLEWDSFNQFRYLNSNISNISSFLEINIILTKNLFFNTLYNLFYKDILIYNENFEQTILQNLKKKSEFLIGINKLN